MDRDNHPNGIENRTRNTAQILLAHQAALAGYPTQIDQDAKHSGHAKSGPGNAMKLAYLAGFATPTIRDHKDGSNVTGWSTPVAADDGHKVTIASHQPGLIGLVHGAITTSSPSETASAGVLNPELSRWLQAYPAAWPRSFRGYWSWALMQQVLGGLQPTPDIIESARSEVTETQSSRRSRPRSSKP